jgi:hypothetical protein
VGCFVAPTALANFFFPGAALPQGFESQALVKLLGCGVAAGAASAFGLKQLTDSNQLASPTAQRLQLGLMGFSSGAHTALHALARCLAHSASSKSTRQMLQAQLSPSCAARLSVCASFCCTVFAGTIALHALYSPSITTTSLLAGAAVMGATFAVPYQVPPPNHMPTCLPL